MNDVTIKLNDASLVGALSEMAKANNHTVESEVLRLLQKAIDDRSKRLGFYRRVQAISAMTPKDIIQTDSTQLLREDRDR